MASFKNITKGPKGVNTDDKGLVFIVEGTSEDLNVSAAEMKSAKTTGWFEIDGDADAEPDAGKLKAAIDGLDSANDAHWTDAGLPAVDAVSAAFGETVTRAQIKAAAPDAKRAA